MNWYLVEVQSCTSVRVQADSSEDARIKLVDDDNLYCEELLEDVFIGEPKLMDSENKQKASEVKE